MKIYKEIYLLIVLLFLLAGCGQSDPNQPPANPDADLSDIIETPPEKKTPPTSALKSSDTINFDPQSTSGTLVSIEDGDYYQLHLKNDNQKEMTFYFWAAYEGADQLNIGNWKSLKGKTINVKWQKAKERNPDNGQEMIIRKILAIDVNG